MTYPFPALETAPKITELLALGVPVAIGVSGGKDSDVATAETLAYLNTVGHKGSRILMHSDLGRIEWKDSLPACERLARRYDLELVVVRRQRVAEIMELAVLYTDPETIQHRYAALMALNALRGKAPPASLAPIQQPLWNMEVRT